MRASIYGGSLSGSRLVACNVFNEYMSLAGLREAIGLLEVVLRKAQSELHLCIARQCFSHTCAKKSREKEPSAYLVRISPDWRQGFIRLADSVVARSRDCAIDCKDTGKGKQSQDTGRPLYPIDGRRHQIRTR